VCASFHAQQYAAVLIIFPPSLQTISIAQTLSTGGEGDLNNIISVHHYSLAAIFRFSQELCKKSSKRELRLAAVVL